MKRFVPLVILASFVLISCCKFDDSSIWKALNNHEDRIETLETLCKQINTNISSIQTIIVALQSKDYVTNVAPIKEGDIEVGYTITFSRSGTITIYHGQDGIDGEDGINGEDGKDGYIPAIGVKRDLDGIYYWTLDDEWLKDEFGNKIPTTGADGTDGMDGNNGENGKNGITPQLKIEDGYWYLSYDNGITWEKIGKATGDNGINGVDGKDGDNIINKITQDDYGVYVYLSDGTHIEIPKAIELNIVFEEDSLVEMSANSTRSIGYEIFSSSSEVTILAISSSDIKAKIIATDSHTGILEIASGNVIDEYSSVVVLVSDERKVIMRSLSFEEAEIKIFDTAQKTITEDGGLVTLDFMTNIEYDVIIPEDASSWIRLATETRAITQKYITLDISKNYLSERNAIVKIQSKDYELSIEFCIRQIASDSKPESNELWYYTLDNSILVPNVETAFNTTIVSNTIIDGLGVIRFDKELNTIGERAFLGCNSLYQIKLPMSVNVIQRYAFAGCGNLATIEIPQGVHTIEDYAFEKCKNMDNVIVGENVTIYGSGVFSECRNLTNISFLNQAEFNNPGLIKTPNLRTINSSFSSDDRRCLIVNGDVIAFAPANLSEYTFPEGINVIYSLNENSLTSFSVPETCTEICDYTGCLALEELTIPLSITSVGVGAFSNNDIIKSIVIPYAVTSVGKVAFQYCDNLTSAKIYCNKISENMFRDCINLSNVHLLNVTEVEPLAFNGCENLKSIHLPGSVNKLGAGVFSGCINLHEIYIHSATPPEPILYFNFWQAFNNIAKDAKIYVPQNSLELYKTTEYWNEFADLYVGYQFLED